MDRRAEWRHFCRRYGVISRREAIKLGMSADQINRRRRSGEWLEVAPHVYRHAAAPDLWSGRVRSAVLSVDGLASHRAAAALWRIDGFSENIVEVVVAEGRQKRRSNFTVHRSKHFDLAGATTRRGLPVTGAARTVLDVAAVVGRNRLETTVDAALRQRLVTWQSLFSVVVRHSARGRDGCGRLRRVLDDRYGEVIPDSLWNRRVGLLLTDAGLPRPVYEYEVRDGKAFVARVDLAYPNLRLAIECDSAAFHLNSRAFVADPRRKNRLLNLGWRVLSFTWEDYADEPQQLVATVRTAIAASERATTAASA